MNLHRTAALFLSAASAATAAVITWEPPIQIRTGGAVSVESTDTATVNQVASYYGNKVVDYYGGGVQVTMGKLESSPLTDGTTSFWSANASKSSVTGSCFKASFAGKSGKTSKSAKSGHHPSPALEQICECNGFNRRKLQWGNDGHSVAAVSGRDKKQGSKSKPSGSSQVETIQVSGSMSKNGGGQWAGDAHASGKKEKHSMENSINVKASAAGGMWAGDAHASVQLHAKQSSKGSSSNGKLTAAAGGMWTGDAHASVTSSAKKSSKGSSPNGKVTAAAGGMWAGDAHASFQSSAKKSSKGSSHAMEKAEIDKITSNNGGSVSFTVTGSSKATESKASKMAVKATWQGQSFGPSTVTTVETSESTLKGASSSAVAISSGSSVTTVKAQDTGTSLDYSCICETEFEISDCHLPPTITTTIPAPVPAPIQPLVPIPSTPSQISQPTLPELVELVEISCKDDSVITSAGVAIEILVLENDGMIPNGSSGAITQPNHGVTIIQDSSILYVPDSNFCGIDTFTYNIIGPNGQAACTATVTVQVICISGATTPPPTTVSTTTSGPPVVDVPTTPDGVNIKPPTMMPLDAPLSPDGGDVDIEKPLANNDYFITNQDESIAISLLLNDTLIEGTTGSYTKPPNGALSTTEDDLVYTPITGFCGTDMFSYTLTDANKEHSDSAIVTIDVICTSTPTPSPDDFNDTMMPTYYTGDDLIGVPQTFNNETIDRPSPEPTEYNGDDEIGVPPNFNNQPDVSRPSPEPTQYTGDEEIGVPLNSNNQPDIARPSPKPTEYNGDDEIGVPPNFNNQPDVSRPSPEPTQYTGDEEIGVPLNSNNQPDIARPSTKPTYDTGDDEIGVPPNFNNQPDIARPSPEPTEYTGDDEISVPPNTNNQPDIDRPDLQDDFATTNQSVPVFIPILDNDYIPANSNGTMGNPSHGEIQATEDGIVYSPSPQFCGFEEFNYYVTDAANMYTDSALVTIEVICSRDRVNDTPSPTPYRGDDEIGVPPNFNNQPDVSRPSPEPTQYTGDEEIGVPLNSNNQPDIARPSPKPTYDTGDDEIGVPPNFNNQPDIARPSPEPTEYTGDDEIGVPLYSNNQPNIGRPSPEPTQYMGNDEIGVPPNFNNQSDIGRPNLEDDFATTNQDVAVIIPILANDEIPNDTTGSFTKPKNGVVTILDGDDVLYTPKPGFCGTDMFTYTITDLSNNNGTATVTVAVSCDADSTQTDGDSVPTTQVVPATGVPTPSPIFSNVTNDKPNTNDDYVTTLQGVSVNVPAMDNDYIIPLNSTIVIDQPSYGVTTIGVADIVYTPSPEFCGFDYFNYTVIDASGMYSDTALVTVEVTCNSSAIVMPKPIAVNDYITIPQDSESIVIDVLENDAVPDDYELNVDKIEYGANNGKCSISDDNITVIYSPNPGYTGQDSCVYSTCVDGGLCDMALVLISVEVTQTSASTPTAPASTANHRPIANDDTATCAQDQTVFINVVANDIDDEDDALTLTSVAQCKEGGTIAIIGDGTGGVVEYSPAPGFFGTDHCDYTVCDDKGECDTACLDVTVEKLSAPPLAVNDATSTLEEVTIEILVTGNDISPNGSPLTIVNVGESSKGASVGIVGDGSSGYALYEPPSGFVGNDSFTYTISNEDGQVSTATVYIMVATKSSLQTTSPKDGSNITSHPNVQTCTTTVNEAVIYVISSDNSSFISEVTNGTHGVCEITANTTVMYTPEQDFTGIDQVEYQMCGAERICEVGFLTISVLQADSSSYAQTMSTVVGNFSIEIASTVLPQTTTVVTGITSTVTPEPSATSNLPTYFPSSTTTPGDFIPVASNKTTAFASFMCPDVDPSSVTENELLYKYPIVLGTDADVYAAIRAIEAEINNRLVTQMRCSLSRRRRHLLVANLVGANNNPPDLPSEENCEDEKGECVVIDGGLTVYGDVDIKEVQDFITAVLPSIVESAGASVIDSLMTSNATLESRSASTNSGSSIIATVAIAGAAIVALVGAALFIRKKKSRNDMSEESEAVLMSEFPQKAPSPREVPHASSDDSDTLLSTSVSFDSKSRKSLKSVFRNNSHNGEMLPSSPAFSVSSSKSKSHDIEDTVDL